MTDYSKLGELDGQSVASIENLLDYTDKCVIVMNTPPEDISDGAELAKEKCLTALKELASKEPRLKIETVPEN